jgi:hypothetical protein
MHDHRREETAREFLARRHSERLEMARIAIKQFLLSAVTHTPADQLRSAQDCPHGPKRSAFS